MIANQLVKIVTAEIGVEEVNGTNRGPRVDEYQMATWLDKKEWGAWCAAFVCWAVREAMKIGGPYTFDRPRTASAWDLERWSLAQDKSTNTSRRTNDIKAGDIVIYNFSHVGIAVEDMKNDEVVVVEGNTNLAGSREGGAVAKHIRPRHQIKARIRFTV